MLDLSKARRRRAVVVPTLVKFMFLCLPWVFVGYGGIILQDSLAFYNNSVATQAEVVLADPSRRATSATDARAVELAGGIWYRPGFLYIHENGQTYVGGAVVESVNWAYRPGQIVDIRYNRLAPDQAQPVTFFKFWWTPASFIIGGVLAFVALTAAFWVAERDPLAPAPRPKRMARSSGEVSRFMRRLSHTPNAR